MISIAGLTAPTALCDAGYVCVSAANSSRPTDGTTGYLCLAGYYCPQGSGVGVRCPAGTYSNATGLHNLTECVDCPPGSYCDIDGESQHSIRRLLALNYAVSLA